MVGVKKADAHLFLELPLGREKKEEGTRAKIAAGQLGVDFYGFREVLEKLGVKYYDDEESRRDAGRGD